MFFPHINRFRVQCAFSSMGMVTTKLLKLNSGESIHFYIDSPPPSFSALSVWCFVSAEQSHIAAAVASQQLKGAESATALPLHTTQYVVEYIEGDCAMQCYLVSFLIRNMGVREPMSSGGPHLHTSQFSLLLHTHLGWSLHQGPMREAALIKKIISSFEQ